MASCCCCCGKTEQDAGLLSEEHGSQHTDVPAKSRGYGATDPVTSQPPGGYVHYDSGAEQPNAKKNGAAGDVTRQNGVTSGSTEVKRADGGQTGDVTEKTPDVTESLVDVSIPDVAPDAPDRKIQMEAEAAQKACAETRVPDPPSSVSGAGQRDIAPPGDTHPVVTPPGDTHPVVTPPGDTHPVVTPPGDTHPVVTPPGDTHPVVTPPGDESPEPQEDPAEPEEYESVTQHDVIQEEQEESPHEDSGPDTSNAPDDVTQGDDVTESDDAMEGDDVTQGDDVMQGDDVGAAPAYPDLEECTPKTSDIPSDTDERHTSGSHTSGSDGETGSDAPDDNEDDPAKDGVTVDTGETPVKPDDDVTA